LANDVTALVRGADAAVAAQATAEATFAGGGVGANLPVLLVLAEGISAMAACTALGFTASNGEAKRKIAEGAVKFNDAVVNDPGAVLHEGKLSLGKKKHGVLKPA